MRATSATRRSYIWRGLRASVRTRPDAAAVSQRRLRRRSSIAICGPGRQTAAGRTAQGGSLCGAVFPGTVCSRTDPGTDSDAPYLPAYLAAPARHSRHTCEDLRRARSNSRRILAWQRQHLSGAPLSALVAKTFWYDARPAVRMPQRQCQIHPPRHTCARFCATCTGRTSTCWNWRRSCRRRRAGVTLTCRRDWRGRMCSARIDAIESTTPSGMRDRAMMLLLATTGLRNRELREIELGDIRWRTGELVLRHTKGHRDRVLPLLEDTGAALPEYCSHARRRPRNAGYFSPAFPVRQATSEQQRHLAHCPLPTGARRNPDSTRRRASSAPQPCHTAGRAATPDQGGRRSTGPSEHRHHIPLRARSL